MSSSDTQTYITQTDKMAIACWARSLNAALEDRVDFLIGLDMG